MHASAAFPLLLCINQQIIQASIPLSVKCQTTARQPEVLNDHPTLADHALEMAYALPPPFEVDARPARLHAMHPSTAPGLTGMAALLQRIVVYEADVPAGAGAGGLRVAARSQPHIQLTLPAGAVPGTVEKFVNMETAVPSAWEPGVQLMTTLRSGSRIKIVPPPGATPGQAIEFSVPFSFLEHELQLLLLQLDALQRAATASPENVELRQQLTNLEGMVYRQLQQQLGGGMGGGMGGGAGSVGGLDAASAAAIEGMRGELRLLAAAAQQPQPPLQAQMRSPGGAAAQGGALRGGGVGSAELEAALAAAVQEQLARLLEAQREAYAAQALQMQQWLQRAAELVDAAAGGAAAAAAAAAGGKGGGASGPPTPLPKMASPLKGGAATAEATVGHAVACQAGGCDEASQTTAVASSRPRIEPAEVAARVVAASVKAAASKGPTWNWYHQVHATPPGCMSGRYR